MSNIEDLKKLNNELDFYLQTERAKKQLAEDRALMTKVVGDQLKELTSPILDTFVTGMNKVTSAIGNIKVDQPVINVPEIKLPQIEVPKVEVVVDTKDINKTIVEAFRGLPEAVINVPEANVVVNVPEFPKIPKLEWPDGDMPIDGNVALKGIDLQNPLPVQLRNQDGSPVDFNFGGTSSGGRSGLSQKDSKALENIAANTLAIDVSGLATETTLAKLPGLSIPIHDYIAMTYVAAGNGVGEIETVIYKTGGSGGTTVATLTLAYNASNEISSVTKS